MYITDKLVSLLLLCISAIETARILCFYPVPFHSHHVVLNILTEELAKQGHELVVLAPISSQSNLPNVTIIDVKDISYAIWEENFNKNLLKLKTISLDAETFWNLVYDTMCPIIEAQLNVPEIQSILKNQTENFDLILVEGCVRSTLVIGAGFKAPIVIVSTFYGIADNYYSVGAMVDPIIFPDFNVPRTWNSNLWNKLSSVYTSIKLRLREWELENVENAIISKYFGEKAPTIAELRKNVQMLLLNVHHVWDYNRPVPPNVLYLGAMHLKNPKPLQNDLKQYLDSSENGVIYMSLGSKVRSADLPSETLNTVMKVFAELPYDVIWKWETDYPPGKLQNVRFEKWLPQNDLLHHPKIKVFITHAGLQSTDEAIAARVPLVGLPVRSDQPTNAAKYEENGIGIKLNIDNINEEDFKNAILTVAENTSYRKNIDKLARIMEEQRFGALDKAVRWINHIATHGGRQLRPPLPDLSFVEYYMLDVIAAVSCIALIVVTSTVLLLNIFLSKINNTLKRYSKMKLS